MGCFTFEELLAAHGGDDLPQPIRHHVLDEACEVCARRLELVRRIVGLLPTLALEPVPARVRAAALAVPEQARRRLPLVLEAVLAAPGMVLALRSGASGTRRQLYRHGAWELDLALDEKGSLLGEVAGEDPAVPSGECTLYGERGLDHARLDPDACFRFEKVQPGPHVLVIESDEAVLVVRDLEIPA